MAKGSAWRWVVAAGLALAAPALWAQALTVPGTGACEVLLRKLAAAFMAAHPGMELQVPPSIGSTGGVRAVLQGQAVLARVARPLRPAESEAGLRQHVFARDAVAVVVGERATVRELSSATLADILAGRVSRWSALGGPDAPIRLLTRETTETSTQILTRAFPVLAGVAVTPQAKLAIHDHDMLELLDRYALALGWITASSLDGGRARLGLVAIDGVAPSAENVAAGRYPATVDYALVYRDGELNPAARAFLAFLASAEGQRALTQAGVVPLGR